ncbi:DUF4253 domain-containing protein [Streptomyces sp. JJ38]|uniref:DUF4253 domain-containing protein n=1 Tax=Streptomyces sp. JJ38 TaxID=2738128 RepID=UPI001C563031|nr:DUF4253 domain-containing protein [Streptomyces sp. JJ38]MBW1598844.1 DUF4253 domain-containing protein [Streptomyces sp. JJ38]
MAPEPLTQLADDPGGRSLGLVLPPGRLIDETDQGTWPYPLLWQADAPATRGQWSALEAGCRAVGLLPVLVDVGGHRGGPEGWDLMCGNLSYPEDFEAEDILADYWNALPQGGPTAPSGRAWPGLAPARRPDADPDALAAETADTLLDGDTLLREPHLALVPAERNADVLAAIGWTGSLNHEDDPGVLSAVLRSWETRFGTRVVALTADQLTLSVAAPPTTPAEAEAVAAEHLAFCPDGVTRHHRTNLHTYAAEAVRTRRTWAFRWD